MTDITKLKTLFEEIRQCEDGIRASEQTILSCKETLRAFENKLEQLYKAIEKEMGGSNEVQVKVSKNIIIDFYWQQGQVVADIPNPDAVPDEYSRIKREPKKIEIKKLLEAGTKFNWASLKVNEPKLKYRLLKLKQPTIT